MRLRFVSTSFMALGALLVMIGLGAMLPQPTYAQQPLPQPSPRPAVQFVEQTNESSSNNSVAYGHITGTVIDSVSGAPVAGMAVMVGDLPLVTDQNGNYDTWLAPGTYLVNVAPTTNQGTVVDTAMSVVVQPNEVTIQHLRVAMPVAEAAPAPVENVEAVVPAEAPRRLPRTNDAADATMVWVSLGVLLMAFGLALGLWPAGRRALVAGANHTLLMALLQERIPARKSRDDELLKRLLE